MYSGVMRRMRVVVAVVVVANRCAELWSSDDVVGIDVMTVDHSAMQIQMHWSNAAAAVCCCRFELRHGALNDVCLASQDESALMMMQHCDSVNDSTVANANRLVDSFESLQLHIVVAEAISVRTIRVEIHDSFGVVPLV